MITAQFITGGDAERIRDLAEYAIRDQWPDSRGAVAGTLTADDGTAVHITAAPTYGGASIEIRTPGGHRVVAHVPEWRPADGPELPDGITAAIVPGVSPDTPTAAPVRALLAGWHCVGRVPRGRYPDLTAMVAAFGGVTPLEHGDTDQYQQWPDAVMYVIPAPAGGSRVVLLLGWSGFSIDAPFWRGFGIGRNRRELHPARVAGATWWINPARWAAEQELEAKL